MVLTGLLRRAAAGAEVPVFLARGLGSGPADAVLRQSPSVRLVDSPRSATVLVVAGRVPTHLAEPLDRVHDQLAAPRTTVWWTGGPATDITRSWPTATVVGAGGDVVAAVVAAHRDVVTGARPSAPPRLPDLEPAEWRGVGPYGQGGTGMTGGVPYGRPMAGRGDDRDGLALDVVPLAVGPFLPAFPPGLVMNVTFAGDVVLRAEVLDWPPDAGGVGGPLPDDAADPFARAAAGVAVPLAELEVARARHHLRWLARLLHLYGLDALARRAVALAASAEPGRPEAVNSLLRRLDRGWVLGRATAGVGVIDGDIAASWGGPVARAAGLPEDRRAASAAYRRLGFEPVSFAAGDLRDRWRQHLAEAAQSLELAGRADETVVEPGESLEWPSPPAGATVAATVARLVAGLEWGDAAATITSLDLVPEGRPAAAASE